MNLIPKRYSSTSDISGAAQKDAQLMSLEIKLLPG
jgi:hypothetical protein